MSQPFYHLRPNKYVDRCLFVNALERLNSQVKLQKHRYIGFGSYLFDDFKLLHDRLNIGTMISLESDSTIFKRAEFNAPYKCISVINQTSTDYISGDNWGEQNSIISCSSSSNTFNPSCVSGAFPPRRGEISSRSQPSPSRCSPWSVSWALRCSCAKIAHFRSRLRANTFTVRACCSQRTATACAPRRRRSPRARRRI